MTHEVYNQKNWKKNVALFLGGQGVTLIGSSLVGYAIMWYVTLKTQSGTMMTVFTIATMLPMFFMSPFGGVWADRFNKKYVINIADLSIAAVTLIIAICFTLGYDNIILLFICAIVRSAAQGVQMPAVTSLIPLITPEDQLMRVNGINTSIQSVSTLGSPALAGVLLTFTPMQFIFYIDVITAIIGVSILFFLVKSPPRTQEQIQETLEKSYFSDIKEGVLYIKNHAFIRRFTFIAVILNILLTPAMLLSMLQVTRNFGPDVWRLSAVELCFSLGMLFGGILIAVWGGLKNKTATIIIGIAIIGLSTIGLGVMKLFIPYLICEVVAGISVPIFSTPIMSIFQIKVEKRILGRVMSVLTMVSSLSVPIGMVIFGPLGDVMSIDILMIITGICTVLVGIYCLFDRSLMDAGK